MAGGGDVVVPSSREQAARGARRRRQTAAWLPLDVVAAIAARSDAATLVRCAATCKDARRRIADDPGFLGRLRLRHTDRFLLPLLRGHLVKISNYKERAGTHLYRVDTTAADADAVRVTKVTFGPQGGKSKDSKGIEPMDSRRGVLLVRMPTAPGSENKELLRVCNPATGRSLTLPPEPPFPHVWDRDIHYVLLVGDGDKGGGAIGRPFKVLKAKLFLWGRGQRRLLLQTFSSEHGAWSSRTEIPTPNLHGNNLWTPLGSRPLVVGDALHWLCLTDAGSYFLMLRAGTARVKETALPSSFPRGKTYQYLVAETLEGPAVLVADDQRISAWVQSKHTKKWKQQPKVVIENKEVLRSLQENVAEPVARSPRTKVQVKAGVVCGEQRRRAHPDP
ncbi:unnamed protein product [Urochloa humidicola]